MTRFSMLALLCFVFVMANGREVYADPQVLAAVPVGEPLEFVCSETTCEVELVVSRRWWKFEGGVISG